MSTSESESESYYDILEISKDATLEAIKKKKRELSIRYHPDKQPEDKKEWGQEMLKKVNDACDILCDPEKRKMYDKFGKEGLKLPQGFGEPGFNFGQDDFVNIGNLFNPPMRVEAVRVDINVSLEDLFKGNAMIQEIQRISSCKKCDNTGFTDKKQHICKSCGGQGTKFILRQISSKMMQKIQTVCDDCNGSGKSNDNSIKCKTCDGLAVVPETHQLAFNIEPGMQEGEEIEIKNEGHEIPKKLQRSNITRGNVVFTISQIKHDVFTRNFEYNGRISQVNLKIIIQIELHEALCGFTRIIKHLDNTDIVIDQYECVNDGDMKVIEQKGMPYRGKSYKFGDLFVEFKVNFPKQMTSTTKIKLYEILTGKKYSQRKIHALPDEMVPSILKDLSNYDDKDHDEYEEKNHHYRSSESCAQQ
jgi:DnaJ-class molecular chaperone